MYVKRFSHGDFTKAFIASAGHVTGIVRSTIEVTDMQMILTDDNLDLKYLCMWVLLILYILLFKKCYILKCVSVLPFGKRKLHLWFSLKQNQCGDLTKMKTETHELKQ